MKNELTLVKSSEFGEVQCDFYGDGKEPWMTRNQVGAALEYSNPGTAIKNIHNRYKARLDKYSRVAQIEPPLSELAKIAELFGTPIDYLVEKRAGTDKEVS